VRRCIIAIVTLLLTRRCLLCLPFADSHSQGALTIDDDTWLTTRVTQLLQGCRLTASDGTVLFTPDASSSYGAQWTRDLSYAFQYAPPSLFGDDAQTLLTAAIRYTYRGQRVDGCMPDRVQADGRAVYGPGGVDTPFADHALDNGPFAAMLLVTHWATWRDASVLCGLAPQALAGLSFLPLRDGLVSDAAHTPVCTPSSAVTVTSIDAEPHPHPHPRPHRASCSTLLHTRVHRALSLGHAHRPLLPCM
jgi:hypothetical protein